MNHENPQEETQDKPHPDQAAYWKRDLDLKESTRLISRMALLVSLLGFVGVIVSVFMNTKQLELNTAQLKLNYQTATNTQLSLRNSTQQSMTTLTLDLDKITIEHPELRQYLEDNANPHNDPANYDRAVESAIMTFDVFDVALSQVGTFKDQWSDPGGWTNWVIDDFKRSPFLREQYQIYHGWYGTNLTDLLKYSVKLPNVAEYRAKTIAAPNAIAGR